MDITPLQNAEFALTFTESNLLWLLGAEPQDNEAIEICKAQITERKKGGYHTHWFGATLDT